MKLKRLLPVYLFGGASVARLNRIKQKQKARERNIAEAYAYMNQWNDIPISQLFGGVCDILKIKRNQAALDLIHRMNMDLRPEDVVKLIPLER